MHRIRENSICRTCSVENIKDSQFSRCHFINFVERHTPEVFTADEMRKVKSAKVTASMAGYAQYIIKKPRDKDGQEAVRQILVDAHDCLIYCNWPIRVADRIMLWNRYAGVLLYFPYQLLVKTIKKMRSEKLQAFTK